MRNTAISISARASRALTRAQLVLVGAFAAALLSACGGGGGGGGTPTGGGGVTSTSSFNVRSGYQARVTAGATDNYAVTGTCAGTAQIVNGATASTTFEGATALSASQMATVNFSNCTPSLSTASGTNYFDSNFALLGSTVTGVEYAKFANGTTPTALPTGAKVGDTGTLSTLTTYTDASKSTVTGSRTVTYAMEADTATTAILNVIVKTFDTSNALQVTQQSRYRVAADGSLTVLTIDVQYSGTSTAHLVYTKT